MRSIGGWSGNTHYGSQMYAFKDGYTGFPAYKNPVLPGYYASAAYAPIQLMDADLSNVPVDQEITYVQLRNLYSLNAAGQPQENAFQNNMQSADLILPIKVVQHGDPTTGYQPLLFDFVDLPADIVLEGVRGATVYDTTGTAVKPNANGVTAVKPGYIILPNDKGKDGVGVYTKKIQDTPVFQESVLHNDGLPDKKTQVNVIRTIVYQGAGAKTPSKTVQTVIFKAVTNTLTGETNWTPRGQ